MSLEDKKIFIVDDDESVCRALSILLGTHGFAVDTFTSADAFFRTIPNSAPGCLLLDIHMPTLDGWERCIIFKRQDLFARLLLCQRIKMEALAREP